jgi:hypothetical protein
MGLLNIYLIDRKILLKTISIHSGSKNAVNAKLLFPLNSINLQRNKNTNPASAINTCEDEAGIQ